nr:MAG TPA: Protein melan-A [Caudoviricetes sp.]
MGSRLIFFFRRINSPYIEDPTLKGHTMTTAAIITIVILSVLLTVAIGAALFFIYIALLMTEERDEYKKKYEAKLSKNIESDAEKIVDDLLAVYRASKK